MSAAEGLADSTSALRRLRKLGRTGLITKGRLVSGKLGIRSPQLFFPTTLGRQRYDEAPVGLVDRARGNAGERGSDRQDAPRRGLRGRDGADRDRPPRHGGEP